jgi:hypothetical protein
VAIAAIGMLILLWRLTRSQQMKRERAAVIILPRSDAGERKAA